MIVWSLFIIDLMGLFFYTKIGSIISIGDLPTTNIIEPLFIVFDFQIQYSGLPLSKYISYNLNCGNGCFMFLFNPLKKSKNFDDDFVVIRYTD